MVIEEVKEAVAGFSIGPHLGNRGYDVGCFRAFLTQRDSFLWLLSAEPGCGTLFGRVFCF
jgi:hypothetical protein